MYLKDDQINNKFVKNVIFKMTDSWSLFLFEYDRTELNAVFACEGVLV